VMWRKMILRSIDTGDIKITIKCVLKTIDVHMAT